MEDKDNQINNTKKKYSLFEFHKDNSNNKIISIDNNKLLPIKNYAPIGSNNTADLSKSNKNLPHSIVTPRTNIEKIIEALNDISDEFEDQDKLDYKKKTQWVIKEILGNKMYKYEEFSEGSVEESKLFQLYSPDFDEDVKKTSIGEDIVEDTKEDLIDDDDIEDNIQDDKSKHQSTISNKPSALLFKININKPPMKTTSFINSFISPLKYESFGTDFDVFDYAEKVGRENVLKQIFKAAMTYKDVYTLLKSSHIENYLEELRIGYSSQPGAYYHNVSSYKSYYILLGFSCI
jgi:hypothetical protein